MGDALCCVSLGDLLDQRRGDPPWFRKWWMVEDKNIDAMIIQGARLLPSSKFVEFFLNYLVSLTLVYSMRNNLDGKLVASRDMGEINT